MRKILQSIHPDDDDHYRKMGLRRGVIEVWEDGMRTDDRKGDISRQNFIDLLSGITKLGANLIGFEGSFLRFEGEATVERIENGEVAERVTEPSAVWELMYFGKAGADKAYK